MPAEEWTTPLERGGFLRSHKGTSKIARDEVASGTPGNTSQESRMLVS